jgi:hypothetical protein
VNDSLFAILSRPIGWVGIDKAQDDARLTAVREVSIDGQVIVPDTRPPTARGRWLPWTDLCSSGGRMFVGPIDQPGIVGPGQLPVARGSLLAWCDAACGLTSRPWLRGG